MSQKSKLEESLFAEIKLYGLPEPVRQFRFHPTRRFAFDFAWPALKIAVEIQGGIFVGGSHSRGAYMEQDFSRLNDAQRLGWKVFQFGPSQVRRNQRTNASSIALAFMYEILRGPGYENSTQPLFSGKESATEASAAATIAFVGLCGGRK